MVVVARCWLQQQAGRRAGGRGGEVAAGRPQSRPMRRTAQDTVCRRGPRTRQGHRTHAYPQLQCRCWLPRACSRCAAGHLLARAGCAVLSALVCDAATPNTNVQPAVGANPAGRDLNDRR
jgi:hypothetical protein